MWGSFQSTCMQCSFTWTGSFSWAPLLQGLISIGISLLQGLIFIGISLLQGLIFIHCFNGRYFFEIYCVFCVCVFQLYFLFKYFFEMLFLCFELYFEYNNKLLSIFKELLVIICFLNEIIKKMKKIQYNFLYFRLIIKFGLLQ